MKWYETPLTVHFASAQNLLNQGKYDAYVKTLKRVSILSKERDKQTCSALEMTSVLAHFQDIDALLHMEQSKLRVMTDEDLSISRMGLMCECGYFALNSDWPEMKRKLVSAKQALGKILREMERRTNVYALDSDYWSV